MLKKSNKLIALTVIDFFIALSLVLSCGSILDNINSFSFYITEILLVILIIRIILCKNEFKTKKMDFKPLFLLAAFQIAYTIVQFFNQTMSIIDSISFIIKIVGIIGSLFILFQLEGKTLFKKYLKYFANIVLAISCISLFFYIFGSHFKLIPPTNQVELNFGFVRKVDSYFWIYFEPQYTLFNGTYILRNCGIFAEGPMFSIVLTIALAYNLFLNEKVSKPKIILLIITIVTSISLTGILLMTFMLVIKTVFFILKKYQNQIKMHRTFIISFMVIFSIVICAIILPLIVDKIFSQSFRMRIDDYIAGFKAWLDHPFFGNGYLNYDSVEKYMLISRRGGQSNSLTNLMAEGGLWQISFYFIPYIINLINLIRKNEKEKIVFLLVLFLLFCTTIFTYSSCILFFIAYGWYLVYSKKREENN